MSKKNLIIGLIPAKKKSRGLKNKNLKKIKGKSLTEIAVINAINSKYIDKVYISTNSKQISIIAQKYKVGLIKRPDNLCRDDTESRKVISHFIKCLPKPENNLKNIIVYLQPTSPLRTGKDIDKAIETYKRKKNQSLISVSKLEPKFLKTVQLKNDILHEIYKNYLTMNRQNLKNFYYLDGFIFIFNIKKFMNRKSFLNKSSPYYTSQKKSIDIDNYSSYIKAKKILENEN